MSVRFVDAQRGFMTVIDGTARGLHLTSNGGESWTRADLDVTPIGVGFTPSGSRLWVVGSGPAFQSTDLGTTFQRLTLPSDFHGFAHLWDDRTGVVTSETGDRIHSTGDGAATWTTHAFGRDVLPGTRRMITLGSHVWIVGGPMSAPGGMGAHVAYSSDRGTSWSISTLQDNAHDLKGGQLLGGFAVSPTDVWVVGSNRQLFHTTDGAGTWTQVVGLPAEVLHLCAVTVSGNTVTVAVSLKESGSYGILESTNGGASFALKEVLRPAVPWDAAGIRGLTPLPGGGSLVYGYAGLFLRRR